MGVRRLICCRRRRLSSYLCVLAFLAVVFFIFQGTSLRLLNRRTAEEVARPRKKEIQPAKPKIEDKPAEERRSTLTILGVRTDDLIHYTPDEDGLFHCIDGAAKVPMAALNDEYCDCPTDGSDEPGTDACPKARFFCELENKFVPSGKVNDGICDCCDGSDEWKITSLKVKGFPLSDVIQHAPCIDTCRQVEHQQIEENRVRQIGLRLKQQYIARAKGHTANGLYGAQGEFYALSQECYDYSDHAASYHICPFKRVEQRQKQHVFKLGSKGSWETPHGSDRAILVMDGGDSRGCPEGPRRTEIHFACGLSNSVAKLSEDEKCVYSIKFITPAAC